MADRNEMNIPLIEGFRLRSDDNNWIVEEEVGKEGKKTWRVIGYYQKLGIALHDLFTLVLRRSPSKTIDDLIQASERTQTSLIRSVEALDAWGLKSETAQKVF